MEFRSNGTKNQLGTKSHTSKIPVRLAVTSVAFTLFVCYVDKKISWRQKNEGNRQYIYLTADRSLTEHLKNLSTLPILFDGTKLIVHKPILHIHNKAGRHSPCTRSAPASQLVSGLIFKSNTKKNIILELVLNIRGECELSFCAGVSFKLSKPKLCFWGFSIFNPNHTISS